MMPDETSMRQIARIQRRNRISAALFWLGALVVLILMIATIGAGKLNPVNLLMNLFLIVGLSAIGLLSLSGDITLNPDSLDEGQREAARAAQATAFYVGYFGVIGLWTGYLLFPGWKAGVTIHLGVLALLIAVVWLGTWVWERWRR
jgi:hypothetical protein